MLLYIALQLLPSHPSKISYSICESTLSLLQYFYIPVSSYLSLLVYGFRTKPNLCLFVISRSRNSPILEYSTGTPQQTRSCSTRTLRSSDILNRTRSRSRYITPDWASCYLPFGTTVGYPATHMHYLNLLAVVQALLFLATRLQSS
jgi:hypothetical protein